MIKWPTKPTPLCALSTGDKGNAENTARHDYTRLYHALFSPIREKVQTVFELGIFQGNSLRMWRDYFPNAIVYGADIDTNFVACAKGDRIVTRQCDETDPGSVKDLLADWPTFDIIIDDALHTFTDNVRFFSLAWERVKPGGFYVIEDLRKEELPLFKQWSAVGYDKRATLYDHSDRIVNGEEIPDNSVLVLEKAP